MKNLKKYVGVLMLLTLLVGFTSCEDDETIFDRIVGRTWIGDLGFESDRHHDPLESGIYLGVDGFGEDQLCYYDNGEYYGKPLRLQWSVGNGTLYIDYGNVAPPRELRNVYVSHGRMTGTLYINGFYYGDVELYMQ